MTHEPQRDDQHTTRRAILASAGLASAGLAGLAGTLAACGKIFAQVVVTQPSSGAFQAFSALCTHMGCTVGQVANGTIDCSCHGNQFSIKNGSVMAGPAPSALPSKAITVTGDNIMLG